MNTRTAKITILLLTAFALLAPAAPSAELSPQVSFDRDIRPILAERCLACHGERQQKGGLRLDAKAFAMRGGQSGPVIVAGKAMESRLYQRVVAQSDDERMPPVGERLSAAEAALLKS
ncbi:MAG: c-type cytochrome domain-containing protein, partial [Blastocatellia bacterium]